VVTDHASSNVEAYRRDLLATRDLIADEDHWTHHTLARTASGKSCDPYDPKASAWCLVGAFARVAGGARNPESVLMELLGENPAFVNDAHGHAAVLALLDRAIREGWPT
jgi:hypothetical protein